MPCIRRGCVARPRGVALLAVLAMLVCLCLVAAWYAVHAQYAVRASLGQRDTLDADLLALSACEEVAAYLTLGRVPPAAAARVVSNRAGRCVGAYEYQLDVAATPATAAVLQAAWSRDRRGIWRRKVPLAAAPGHVAKTLRRARHAAAELPLEWLAARLADACDPDDEVSVTRGVYGGEALAPARLQASRAFAAVAFARYDTAAWVNPSRLARGWGARYTAPMHLTAIRRRSDVSSRRASLVFSRANLDEAARAYAREVDALAMPGLHPLGAEHQWRGSLIKGVGRDTDSCLGGALTNVMWLRVVDNVLDNGDMRFECEPALEETFADQFLSNALSGSITYGFAGWHVHGDPLLANVPAALTEPGLSGLLAPARCAAELADARPPAYVGGAALVRALDPRQTYRVALVAAHDLPPPPLEVWQQHDFAPVTWAGARALLYDGKPQQPVHLPSGEGALLIVFRAPASAAAQPCGLAGVELAAQPPHAEWQVTTPCALDVRLWELVWLGAAGRTQTLQRVPLRCQQELPELPSAARVRWLPDAQRLTHSPAYSVLPVQPLYDGPWTRVVDAQPLGVNPYTGLTRYRLRVADPVRAMPPYTTAWVRVWPARFNPDLIRAIAHVTNPPLALAATFVADNELQAEAPAGSHVLPHALERGVWLEHASDWLGWQGELALRTPRGELAARIPARAVPFAAPGSVLDATDWPPRWRPSAPATTPSSDEPPSGFTPNAPPITWRTLPQLLPPAWRDDPRLAAACVDAFTVRQVPAYLSNLQARAGCWRLAGAAALSNVFLQYSWPPLRDNVLRGYYAQLDIRGTRLRGLILSNDRSRIILDLPRHAPRAVEKLQCTVTTPTGEPLWYVAPGAHHTFAVACDAAWKAPAYFSLHVLKPASAALNLAVQHYASRLATQCVATCGVTWLSPLLDLSSSDDPLVVTVHAPDASSPILFTRPAWQLVAEPVSLCLNTLAAPAVAGLLSHDARVCQAFLAARPFSSWSDCLVRVPLPASDVWRLADAATWHPLAWQARVSVSTAHGQTRHTACFSVVPRERQSTAAVSWRLAPTPAFSPLSNASVHCWFDLTSSARVCVTTPTPLFRRLPHCRPPARTPAPRPHSHPLGWSHARAARPSTR